jgi:hypothetical protein
MGGNPNILHTFSSATGLQINWSKSTFHYANLREQSLTQLKELFPHNFVQLSEGFNYLGYFIKADSYKIADWNWLVAKVEKRIGHWCNHWLSLGGRYTLIKAVLEGQPVYWMALAAIPVTVLHKLRKLSFNFLWTGCTDSNRLHLCSWDALANQNIREVGGSEIFYTLIKLWLQTHSGVC